MDIPTTMTPMQLLLVWMLMGLLLAWMIVFAFLALKPEPEKKSKTDLLSSSTGSFPQLHVIVQQTEKIADDIQFESTAASNSHVRG